METNNRIGINVPLITDGGLETTLIFNHGINLRHFAAFEILDRPEYEDLLVNYYCQYLELAKERNIGFMMISGTWRANKDWGKELGYSEEDLININKGAIRQINRIKSRYGEEVRQILVCGSIGPRSDGYLTKARMTHEEATTYHALQLRAFKEAAVDVVSAFTQNYIEEALGITIAAKLINIPIAISFTVETDGKLPSGETLAEAIERIDQKTNCYPSFYLINCAHPTHFVDQLERGTYWISRIEGIMANSSCKSHAELDEATELDRGDKDELAEWYDLLQMYLPNLKVFGGCCGTDIQHIQSISEKIKHPTVST